MKTKVIEKLSLYELAIVGEVKRDNRRSNSKKTKDDVVMDKLNLTRRLENCIKIKEINE